MKVIVVGGSNGWWWVVEAVQVMAIIGSVVIDM